MCKHFRSTGEVYKPHGRDAQRLADVFSKRARMRIRRLFAEIGNNADDATYRLAQDVLKGKYAWIEDGAIQAWPDEGTGAPPSAGAGAAGTTDKREAISGTRVATQVGAGA